MNIQDYMQQTISATKQASSVIATASTEQKNHMLLLLADDINNNKKTILAANSQDMQVAHEVNIEAALLDRLELNEKIIDGMIASLHQVVQLPDPVGSISDAVSRPSGITVGKMRTPLGVVGIIYESRPNVTCEAASLCLKSGNAAILRGGSEAIHSNLAIADCLDRALVAAGLPKDVINVVTTTDRAAVSELLKNSAIDVLIPRGGRGLIERVIQDACMPIIKHLDGNCHVYIDEYADIEESVAIVINAKTHRYGVCNAAESLLVHQSIAEKVLLPIAEQLSAKGVEMRGCIKTQAIVKNCQEATEADWQQEYLAPIISIKVVSDMDAAISHINCYGSGHTDAIATNSHQHAMRFLREVNSSSVMVNASTRFADGFEYGLGAEIGISTDKFHARGPVGLEGLTSQKWIVLGQGQVRK